MVGERWVGSEMRMLNFRWYVELSFVSISYLVLWLIGLHTQLAA